MAEVRKQRFMVSLDDDAFRKIRVLRAVTGKTYQEILSEAVRLLAQHYEKDVKEVMG